jgi:hypothetical protein
MNQFEKLAILTKQLSNLCTEWNQLAAKPWVLLPSGGVGRSAVTTRATSTRRRTARATANGHAGGITAKVTEYLKTHKGPVTLSQLVKDTGLKRNYVAATISRMASQKGGHINRSGRGTYVWSEAPVH